MYLTSTRILALSPLIEVEMLFPYFTLTMYDQLENQG